VAKITWDGGRGAVAQVVTVTPATVAAGNVFTLAIGDNAVSFTATAGTAANVTAGLAAAIAAAGYAEFGDLEVTDNAGTLTLAARTAGLPFTVTASAAAGGGGGSPTLTAATTTANASPNDFADGANWSGGVAPTTGDDVIFDETSTVDCLYGLNQNTLTFASLTVGNGYTGSIGLPNRNPDGYTEYRGTHLRAGVTLVNVGQGGGNGPGRLRLDTGTVVTTVNVFGAGNPTDGTAEAIHLKGSHASNVLEVLGGGVGVAVGANDAAQFATVRVGAVDAGAGGGPAVRFGAACTLGALQQAGGTVQTASTFTSAHVENGTFRTTGAAGCGALTTDSGTFICQGTGSVGALVARSGGVLDFSQDMRPKAPGTITLYKDAALLDDHTTIPTATGIVCPDGVESVKLRLGKGITLNRV
jgi:hypothetical protein